MKSKVVQNYLYNLSYQMLIMILPLITTPYLSRVLGADGLGKYSYTNSITQYFILFGAIGLNLYGQREIAYVQDDIDEYSKTFYEVAFAKLICLSLSIVIYYVMAINYHKYTSIFLIQVIDIIASIFDISWFYQGIEEFKKIVIRNYIVKISGVVSIFIFVRTTDDLLKYIFIYSSILLLGNLSMWIYIPNLTNLVNIKKLNLNKHIRPAIVLFIPQISVSLYTLLDKTMIGLLSGSDIEVSYYDQSQKLVKLALTIITSVGTVMMPRIANFYAKGEEKLIRNYMKNTFSFVFIISSPIMFGIIGIANNFVPWFFGPGFDKVTLNMIILTPIIFLVGISNIIGIQFLLPTGKQKPYTLSVVIGSIVNIVLNIVLIPKLFSYGASIATIVAEASVTAIQFHHVRKMFNLRKVVKNAFKYIFFGLIMMIVVCTVGSIIGESTFIVTIIQILIGLIIYCLLLFLSKDNMFINFIKRKR